MPLSGLLEEANKLVRGQVAAAPMARPVRALGPQAWPGRGTGIRGLADYLDSLRKVEGRIGQRRELAGRLRTCRVRFWWQSYFVFKSSDQTWESSPSWYWDEANRNNVEPSVTGRQWRQQATLTSPLQVLLTACLCGRSGWYLNSPVATAFPTIRSIRWIHKTCPFPMRRSLFSGWWQAPGSSGTGSAVFSAEAGR